MNAKLRTTTIRPDQGSRRLPASGNTALAASALLQTALGIEFILSGLNKFADPRYVQNFNQFVSSNPGTQTGILSGLVKGLVLPNVAFFATVLQFTELALGIVLLLGALEVGRRRFSGRFGREHGYEAPVALVSCLAGLAVAGLSLSIAVLMGEQLPTIMPGRAFTTAIPVELLLVPLGIAVAWMEAGRFLVLYRHRPASLLPSARPQVIPVNEGHRAG
ncbi:MAG: DoxX family membrane protein [Chloroflexi bacterium]|nr:MAG: DoxX family membrane protein [Chloroflexota bacterium]